MKQTLIILLIAWACCTCPEGGNVEVHDTTFFYHHIYDTISHHTYDTILSETHEIITYVTDEYDTIRYHTVEYYQCDSIGIPNVGSNFNEYYVTDNGAVSGDGQDDINAINNLITIRSVTQWGNWGTIIVPGGTWNISGPIKPTNMCNIQIAKNAVFLLPSGYEGSAILFEDGYTAEHATIEGGYFLERSPAQNKWTGIKVNMSSGSYLTMSTIRDMVFHHCNIGIELNVENGGWINDNLFERIVIKDFRVGIKIVDGIGGGVQVRGNKFTYTGFQGRYLTEAGVILPSTNEKNQFIGCTFWDFEVSQHPNLQQWIDPNNNAVKAAVTIEY